MQNVIIRRYSDPVAVGGWSGWIEPEDKSWILFIPLEEDAAPVFFPLRDADGGVIVSPEERSEPEA